MQPTLFSQRRPAWRASAAIALIALVLSAIPAAMPALAAPVAPPNFQVQPVFAGLKNPTDFAFAPDGRVFVAEKAGLIKVFDGLGDQTPDIFADLQTNVYKGPNDHGILGLALDCYRPGDCHEHLMEELTGAGGAFTTEDHEDLPVVELRLTATDAGGLSNTASAVLNPYTTTLTLQSSPPNLKIAVDTDDVTTPANLSVVAGSAHTLIAPAVQSHRSFTGWLDGSTEPLRQIKLGSAPASYTASYANRSPSARFSVAGGGPRTALFDAALATDPEGDTLSYAWDFGDRATGVGSRLSHAYAQPGTYKVRLTVSDQLGAASSAEVLVQVRNDGVASIGYRLWLPSVVR